MTQHSHFFGHALDEFHEGVRVELHPGTDLWMRGARYGTVVRTLRKYVRVELDANSKVVQLLPELLSIIN